MVKKLEEELNIVIFDRKTSPISTTKQGLEIILQAQQVVAHAQKLVASAKTRTQKLEGRMKVGIIPTIACSDRKISAPGFRDLWIDDESIN